MCQTHTREYCRRLFLLLWLSLKRKPFAKIDRTRKLNIWSWKKKRLGRFPRKRKILRIKFSKNLFFSTKLQSGFDQTRKKKLINNYFMMKRKKKCQNHSWAPPGTSPSGHAYAPFLVRRLRREVSSSQESWLDYKLPIIWYQRFPMLPGLSMPNPPSYW